MEKLNRKISSGSNLYPERVLQFGNGNFLRAFADWIIYELNKDADFNSGVVVVSPRDNKKVYNLNKQDGLYTLIMNGVEKGELKQSTIIIDSITRSFNTYDDYDEYLKTAENPELRFIISNTTEAGIEYIKSDRLDDRPQTSFPGKLTAWLYHRYKIFNGDKSKGVIVLPCELIDKNGDSLRKIILQYILDWELGKDFAKWVEEANIFCNTLVDRIVPGYPKENAEKIFEKLGYHDDYLVEAEWFYLWVIEGRQEVQEEFPTNKIGLNVVFVDDIASYRERKVRILNGVHTCMVPVSYLYGKNTVKESLEDEVISEYINGLIFEEIIPTLDFPEAELRAFAETVLDRFRNPFIKHYLISISLNSMSKFRTRVLPSIMEYYNKKGELPDRLVFSLASLIYFYKGDRDGEKIELEDSKEIIDLYKKLWNDYENGKCDLEEIVKTILALKEIWGLDLNGIENMTLKTTNYLSKIVEFGMKEALESLIN